MAAVLIDTKKLDKYISRKLMTRKELADVSGVCFSTIAHLFSTPTKKVKPVTIKRLCKVLEITPEDILADE